MCGIFYYRKKGEPSHVHQVQKSFYSINKRGPDVSLLNKCEEEKDTTTYIGFHRLAINDLSENGNQPFISDNVILICNGEIYNYKQLASDYNIKLKSNSLIKFFCITEL